MNTLLLGGLIAAYLAVVAALSYLGYRHTRSQKDYLVGGNEVNPFVMAMSYGAAFISTSAIVGFGGVAGLYGMGLLWLPFMNIAVGVLIAFLVLGRPTRRIGRRLDANTFPELIGLRFQSRRIKVLIAAIIVFFMPIYTGVVLIGGARFVEQAMNLDYNYALLIFGGVISLYVIFGGIKGVMYVDALLGVVMVFGMISLLVMTYHELGGVVSAHQALTDMRGLVPASLAKLGHAGWTAMPRWNSQWWWTLVSSLMLGVGIGALAQPQLAVRFMTVKSGKQLNRAVLVGALFILATAGIAYVVGALANVWFFRHSGQIAIQAADGNADLIIPRFIDAAMPKAFVYIFMLTLLSAAMSTLSSLIHVNGSSLGHDLYRTLRPQASDSRTATRVGIVLGIIASIVLAYLLPPNIVARGTAIFFGVCAAAFLPAYLAALYWKRATRAGVWASIATGALVSLFGLAFLHRAESGALGICQKLFGRTELISTFPWPFVDTICYALPLAALALIAVSLATRPPDARHLEQCFSETANRENHHG